MKLYFHSQNQKYPMNPHENDILVEIPDKDLPKLVTVYQKHILWASHVVSLIHTGIQWKKVAKYRECYTFFSVRNSWEEDGTIIVVEMNHCYNISVFTLDPKCTNLRLGLTQTNLLDYKNENAYIFCVHEKHVSAITQVIEDLKLKAAKNAYLWYALPPSHSVRMSHPTDVYLQKLDLRSAQQINSFWAGKFKGSEKYIASLIAMNGGYGLFLKSTNEMVAWILRYSLGYVGLLQTVDQWKRKGFGKLVTQALVKDIVEEGHWPFATIASTNGNSVRLFEQLGFRNMGEITFFSLT